MKSRKRYTVIESGDYYVVFDLLTGDSILPKFAYWSYARRRARYLNQQEKEQ